MRDMPQKSKYVIEFQRSCNTNVGDYDSIDNTEYDGISVSKQSEYNDDKYGH